MNYKRLGSMALMLLLLVFPVSASMVSFLLVETGLKEEVPSTQYTSVWEGGLMAAFFDAGHIVTNGPIARMETRPPMDFTGFLKDDFDEAILGGAEYFILGFLEYQILGGKPFPVGIVLKIYTTDSQILVHEQSFTAGTGNNFDEEFKIAQNAGWAMISYIKER